MAIESIPHPDRRAVIVGLTAMTAMASGTGARAARPGELASMAAAMRACIDECQKCHTVCLTTATELRRAPALHRSSPAQILAMLDSAQICATTADFMARGSAHHAAMCRLCADICEACIRACTGMPGMETCLAACVSCAKSCRAMAAMG